MPLDLSDSKAGIGLDLSQRLPPANLEAEQALLGALLANNSAYDRVGSFLRPDHFSDPIHGRIYQAIARRVEAGRVADAVTLRGDFEQSLDEVGGVGYLAQLLTAMVGIANTGDYGRAIKDSWLRRQTIEVGTEIVNEALCPTVSPEADGAAVISAGVARLLSLAEDAQANGEAAASGLGNAAEQALRNADAASRGERAQTCLWTGIRPFDEVWGGLWPGELSYFAARSGTGKSPAMAAIARNVAARLVAGSDDGCVHIVSMEMPREALAQVSLAGLSGLAVDRIRKGRLTREEWEIMLEHQQALAQLPIVIDDAAGMTLGTITTRAHVMRRTKKSRLLLIDYMEMIGKDREHARMPQLEWIPYLGNRLKALAKALGIPIIVLRQINKTRDREASTRPTISDLPYDAGQAADVTVALWREEVGVGVEPPPPGRADQQKQNDSRSSWIQWRESIRGRAQFGALRRRVGPSGSWKNGWFDGPRMMFVTERPASLDKPQDQDEDDIPY